MNFNNQHSSDQHASDEIIDRDLKALREAPHSAYGMGDAIKAMQSTPKVSKGSLRWPIGLGSLAVAGGTLVLVISVSTGKAYARELHEISSAQEKQKMVYSKSVIYQGSQKPERVLELWIDHNKETMRQFQGDGTLTFVNVCDGRLRYVYDAGNAGLGLPRSASIEVDRMEHTTIDTVDKMLQSEFFRTRKIEKKSGVMLKGRKCDYYNFANGYYRLWVDPATKLPLQREIYDKGVTLWERDTYEYPTSLPKEMFEEPKIAGMQFFDYPKARQELADKLVNVGQTQKVGDITVDLRAIVKDEGTIAAIWTTSNGQMCPPEGVFTTLEIEGTEPGTSFGMNLAGLPYRGEAKLFHWCRRIMLNKPLSSSFKVKIAAWDGKKMLGKATFTVNEVSSYPSVGQLFAVPVNGGGIAKATTTRD